MMLYTKKGKNLLLLALAAVCLTAAPSFAVEYYLCVQNIDMAMPDASVVPMWGFAQDNNANLADGCPVATATVPGPKLIVPPGDNQLIINLRNDLGGPGIVEPVSVVIPGQALPDGAAPVFIGDRVRSFVQETATGGGTQTYTWNDIQPGSYLYQSGTHPQVQVQMGLYGAVTKNSAAGMAYPGVPFTEDIDLFFSEVDPALHAAVADGSYGTPPWTSSLNYRPSYFLLHNYNNSTPVDITIDTGAIPPACIDGTSGQGESLLLRMYNAGLRELSPMMLGAHYDLVAEGGKPYPFARTQYETLLMPGTTRDAVFTPRYRSDYKMIERRLNLTDAAATGGGMQTCIIAGPLVQAGIADFNNDGNADILLRNMVTGSWMMNLMNGTTVTLSTIVNDLPTDLNLDVVGIDDFNNDGNADVLLRNRVNGRWFMNLMDGATVSLSSFIPGLSQNLDRQVVGIADFNNDGNADILVRNVVNGRWFINLMDGASVTESTVINANGLSVNLDRQVVGIGDFNNDGNADILVRNMVNGKWFMNLMNGTTVTESTVINGNGLSRNIDRQVVGIGDFNNDGNADILVRNMVNGKWFMNLMNGTTVTESTVINGNGLSRNTDRLVVEVADFNNDGNADILVRNMVNGKWFMNLMNGTTVTDSTVINGSGLSVNLDRVVAGVADLNNDGSADVVLRNRGNGRWFINLMNGTAISTSTIVPDLTFDLLWQ